MFAPVVIGLSNYFVSVLRQSFENRSIQNMVLTVFLLLFLKEVGEGSLNFDFQNVKQILHLLLKSKIEILNLRVEFHRMQLHFVAVTQ